LSSTRNRNGTENGNGNEDESEDVLEIWHFRRVFALAVVSGALYGVVNVLIIYSNTQIAYGLVQVLINFSSVVSILYGILIWKELQGTQEILLFSVLVLSLIAGSIMVIYGVY
jgi:glucose uptake protein GlcU